LYQGALGSCRRAPEFQREQVFNGDLSLAGAIKRVFTKIGWQIRPLDFGHSLSKGHSCKLILDRGDLGLVVCCPKPFGKIEETTFLRFLGLNALLDQVFDHAIRAPVLVSGDLLNFPV